MEYDNKTYVIGSASNDTKRDYSEAYFYNKIMFN